MKHKRELLRIATVTLACSLVLLALILSITPKVMQSTSPRSIVAGSVILHTNAHANTNAPTPFMYRPYYGTQSIAQRTTSFVDHDKPWYVTDGIFVRYDGARWTNVPIGSCTGGVNCYDGHDGYDLNLWFEPVLSVAAGTVIRAGWYNPSNHESAYGLWAAVDHHNGYATAYGHLSALMVSVGENVGTQWRLGTSGTTGSSTGPHLHLATYYLPNWSATDPFGWTGSYTDPNVVPDYYLWVNNPGTSYTVPDLSNNGNAVYPGATLVDDGNTGWSSTGTWNVASSSTDIHGSLHWTPTASGAATATATWQPTLTTNGYYEVGVFVDDNNASSGWAPYTINSADPNNPGNAVSHIVYLDEEHIGTFPGPYGQVNTGPQWVSLGTYYFSSSVASSVVLSNATGETGLQLAADAVEFAPVNTQGQQPQPTYGFQVTSDSTPSKMQPSGTTHVNLTLNNTSNFTWNATGSNAVQLTYQWFNAQNQPVCPFGGAYRQHVVSQNNNTSCPPTTVPLPQNVAPNASVNMSASVQTPATTGTYTLQWDMAQGNTVFSQQGAKVKSDTVNVTTSGNVLSPLSASAYATLSRTYYFAEGYTGTGTTEYLSLTNPSSSTANVTITFLYQGKAAVTRSYTVAPQSHRVLDINQEAGANQSFGMIVQSDQPFVAERTMYTRKGAFSASSDSTGSSSLSSTWYFAEGNTTYGWNTLLAVLNPSTQPVTVNVAYLLQQGSTSTTSSYTIAARSRGTIILNKGMPNQQFGMAITATSPVLIERPEFLAASTLHGGNSVVGATAPSTSWYFGGGNTTPGFSEQLVLANPSTTTATAHIRYLTTNGQVITQSTTIPARSQVQVNVNNAVIHMQHATVINASVPIIAERQDFFTTTLNGPIAGSTITMGSPTLHASWYFAHGDTASGHAEYIALANPSSKSAQISVAYCQSSGTPIVKTYTLAPNSRMTINLNSDVGANNSVGIAIYATTPIMVEQVSFFNMDGLSGGFASGGVGVD
ncbi:MAG TPA: DUF5719 family protein [Ktedonobacteraceae bacterium]|nr:DUF5719 family protein [Ktedonobacteraceae bacterium]